MAAPFDYADISRRAEQSADELRASDSYRDDIWRNPVLGPLVRVYALLTDRPNDAFDETVTPEYVAECRMYAFVLFATIHDGLVGADTLNDGVFDLLSENDSLVGADFDGAMKAAKADGKRRLAKLKKSGVGVRVAQPGTVRRIPKGRG